MSLSPSADKQAAIPYDIFDFLSESEDAHSCTHCRSIVIDFTSGIVNQALCHRDAAEAFQAASDGCVVCRSLMRAISWTSSAQDPPSGLYTLFATFYSSYKDVDSEEWRAQLQWFSPDCKGKYYGEVGSMIA